jgi:hypothetical protein
VAAGDDADEGGASAPGEMRDTEVQMAARRTLHGVKSAENLIDAIDIWRTQKQDVGGERQVCG